MLIGKVNTKNGCEERKKQMDDSKKEKGNWIYVGKERTEYIHIEGGE